MTEYQLTHPLTDAELHDKFNGYREEGWCNSIYCPDDMRAVADWQLNRVLDWLGKNLSNYSDDSYLGDMSPLHRLDDDLKEAMRPTQENN